MALSGLAWALFVLGHLTGNLLIFSGPEAYNQYSHFLVSNKLVWVARAGLLGTLVLHVYLAFHLTALNRKSRGQQAYAITPNGNKGTTLASRTMIFQGTLILVFVIFHIQTFSLGPYYEVTYNGVVMRDIFRLIIEVFKQPLYVLWYIVCLALLGVHLSHGVGSLFQSLGLRKDAYANLIRCVSVAYGVLIAVGFISLPIYVYLFA